MKLTVPALLMLAALAGCQASTPLTENTNACGAKELQGLMGQPVSALDSVDLPEQTRVIRRDDAVTMDHRLDRLNIAVDPNEMIEGVACG